MILIRAAILPCLALLILASIAVAQDAQTLFDKGYSAFKNKDFAGAELLFREGLKQGGLDAEFRGLADYYLAEALREQNKSIPEAIDYYGEVVRLIPDSKEAIDAAAKARALKGMAAGAPVTPPRPEERPTTLAFMQDGSWSGSVTAYEWRGINTVQAWAIGRHSKQDAVQDCLLGNGVQCVRELLTQEPIEIFANCEQRIVWQKRWPDRYNLSDLMAKKSPETDRGRSTVASWFAVLCPNVWRDRTK